MDVILIIVVVVVAWLLAWIFPFFVSLAKIFLNNRTLSPDDEHRKCVVIARVIDIKQQNAKREREIWSTDNDMN